MDLLRSYNNNNSNANVRTMSIFDPGPLASNGGFSYWVDKFYEKPSIQFYPSVAVVKSKLKTILSREIVAMQTNKNLLKRFTSLLAVDPNSQILNYALTVSFQVDNKLEISMASQNLVDYIMKSDKLLMGWGIINAVVGTPKECSAAVMIPNQKLQSYWIRMIIELTCWWIEDPEDNFELFADHATLYANDRANTLLHGYRITKSLVQPYTLENYKQIAVAINELCVILYNNGMANEWDTYFGSL